jgi:hypothetical protein
MAVDGFPVDIYLSDDYGVVIKCFDKNMADDLDDFITENYYVFYENNFSENGVVSFYFGQASSIEKVTAIYAAFHEKNKA